MSDVRASLAAIRCLVRGLPLFLGPAPRTPLRVLAIVALDTVHTLRRSRPLPRQRLGELAGMLDFQAGTNAVWDGKPLREAEYSAGRKRLERAGLGWHVQRYLEGLQVLEAGRPRIGGDRRSFDGGRAYREAVVRLSLATVTAVALEAELEDDDTDTLFRMAMLCQVIDDVLDYPDDLAAGLPSFLTSTSIYPAGVEWTAEAARSYGARAGGVLPLRVALRVVSAMAQLVVRWAGRIRSVSLPQPEVR